MKGPRRTQETVETAWDDALPYAAPRAELAEPPERRKTGAREGPPDLRAKPVLLVRDTHAIYNAFQRFTRDVRRHARVRVSDACIGRAAVRVLLRNQAEIIRAIDASRMGDDREARTDDLVRVLERAFGLRPPAPAPAPPTVDALTDTSRLQYPAGSDSQGGEG